MKVFLLLLLCVPPAVAAQIQEDVCKEMETAAECAARVSTDLATDVAGSLVQVIRGKIEGPCANARNQKICLTKEVAKWKIRINNVKTGLTEYPLEFTLGLLFSLTG